jgi:putative membrane protein
MLKKPLYGGTMFALLMRNREETPDCERNARVDFIIHIVVTAIALLLISKLLRGFEINNWFTALVTALILGLLHPLIAPFAEHIGRFVGGIVAATALAYPIKVAVLILCMFVLNALVLKLVAAIGPGFRISDFKTALLGALLLVLFNGLIGEAVGFAREYLSTLSNGPPT